jgi:hypothetical protein
MKIKKNGTSNMRQYEKWEHLKTYVLHWEYKLSWTVSFILDTFQVI